jgi:hypothetical protein
MSSRRAMLEGTGHRGRDRAGLQTEALIQLSALCLGTETESSAHGGMVIFGDRGLVPYPQEGMNSRQAAT